MLIASEESPFRLRNCKKCPGQVDVNQSTEGEKIRDEGNYILLVSETKLTTDLCVGDSRLFSVENKHAKQGVVATSLRNRLGGNGTDNEGEAIM